MSPTPFGGQNLPKWSPKAPKMVPKEVKIEPKRVVNFNMIFYWFFVVFLVEIGSQNCWFLDDFWMRIQMCCTLTNIAKYQFPHEEIDVFEGWCYLEVIKKHQNEGQKSCLKTMSNFCWFLVKFGTILGWFLDVFLSILGNKNKMMSWKVPITLQKAKKAVSRGSATLWESTKRAIFWPSWPWWGVGGYNKKQHTHYLTRPWAKGPANSSPAPLLLSASNSPYTVFQKK